MNNLNDLIVFVIAIAGLYFLFKTNWYSKLNFDHWMLKMIIGMMLVRPNREAHLIRLFAMIHEEAAKQFNKDNVYTRKSWLLELFQKGASEETCCSIEQDQSP